VQSFGGSPYDGPKFREFCDEEGIFLVEDSAHAIGARIGNVPIQSYSHLACLSFSTLKNVVTLGEGGAIVTNTPEFGEAAKKLVESRALGTGHTIEGDSIWKGTKEEDRRALFRPGDAFDWSWLSVEEIGLTLRLNGPAALMGSLQLDRLETIIRKRQNQRDYYASKLNILRTSENWLMGESIGSSNHLVNLFINDEKTREKILKSMDALGYAPVIRYLPISYQSVPRWFGLKPGMTPVYENIFFRHLISLPIGPRLTRSLQKKIIMAVNLATSGF
jgi:dTDP-4-amino-4,6-dideoxygalactose transaminase